MQQSGEEVYKAAKSAQAFARTAKDGRREEKERKPRRIEDENLDQEFPEIDRESQSLSQHLTI